MTQPKLPEHPADIVGRLLYRVYEIHNTILEQAGEGIEGIRDAPMLHAAVTRPFATFEGHELYPSDFEKAAALFHSLIKSHPFLDGTKRTALTAALYMLHERGYVPRAPLPKDEVVRFCVEVAEEEKRRGAGEAVRKKTIAEISSWLRGLVEAQG